ncbi:MAG: BatD family protein [Bacteroidota bacterium]
MQTLVYFSCLMRKVTTILLLLFLLLEAKAQVIFKTTVQKSTVVVGESFFVEYMLEDIEKNDGFSTPHFNGLRLVTGPNVNAGKVNSPDGPKAVKNFLFTLVALNPGKLTIPGATARVNGRFIKSDDVIIQAVEKTEKSETTSEYFLLPGEDPYEKMRKNLFMKVMVDKRTCYIGEPVVATFKLYSRLQSKSDIVKNPGFYGFSVQDIINLDNRISNTEMIDGKIFDVHTIRTVQLYPLQPGMFMIDPMEVMNKVEFSKSAVNKKTEQEIVEGYFEKKEQPKNDNNTVTFENSINTEKIAINVKPYPEKNRPAVFNGATGNFTIHAALEKNDLAKNEEGDLIITIKGKGNFSQLSAPAIQWPDGIEGFDAAVKDSLDKTKAPLSGTRVFRYPFVSSKPASYSVPSIIFSFFNPDTGNYKIVSTPVIQVNITGKEMRSGTPEPALRTTIRQHKYWIFAGIAALFCLAGLIWYLKKRKPPVLKTFVTNEETKTVVAIDDLLVPAGILAQADHKQFYSLLHQAAWQFFALHFNLSGSEMKKTILSVKLETHKINPALIGEVHAILNQLEAGMFTDADLGSGKKELLEKTRVVLKAIQSALL